MDIPARRLDVAVSPHRHDGGTLTSLQLGWVLALLPAAIAGVVAGGWPALRVLTLAVGACGLIEIVAARCFGGKDTPENLSSITLGLLLGILLPVTAPWWLVLVASALLIVAGKKLFGGWGGWPVHPVALVMAMLMLSWPARMDYTAANLVVEPVRLAHALGDEAAARFSTLDLLLGRQSAGTASGMALWLMLGGAALALSKLIPWRVPVAFLGGAALSAWLLREVGVAAASPPLFTLFAGSTILAAFFLATDHTTCPVNAIPQCLYGLLGGTMLVMIRTFGAHPDGAIYAILLMNLASPLLDRWTPRPLGLEEDAHA